MTIDWIDCKAEHKYSWNFYLTHLEVQVNVYLHSYMERAPTFYILGTVKKSKFY